MTVREQITSDYTTAVKARDRKTKEVLSLLRADIKTADIDARQELDDVAVLSMVQKQIKKAREARVLFAKGGRNDLVTKTDGELEILSRYVPAQLSESEIEKVVMRVIAETGAATPQDMGRVMGGVMKEVSGKADGAVVQRVVYRILSRS